MFENVSNELIVSSSIPDYPWVEINQSNYLIQKYCLKICLCHFILMVQSVAYEKYGPYYFQAGLKHELIFSFFYCSMLTVEHIYNYDTNAGNEMYLRKLSKIPQKEYIRKVWKEYIILFKQYRHICSILYFFCQYVN